MHLEIKRNIVWSNLRSKLQIACHDLDLRVKQKPLDIVQGMKVGLSVSWH